MKLEKAVFAAGCFWGVQQAFDEVPGVAKTTVGYSGGGVPRPNYPLVCTGLTGHAESVEVEFDPKKVSFQKLLEKFWSIHDPTQVNRQGPDVGTQYRSAIFYCAGKQKQLAEKSAREQNKKRGAEIATEISPAGKFWPAEEYHQKYYLKHPGVVCRY